MGQEYISKERTFIMTLAMLAIMLFHQYFLTGPLFLGGNLMGHLGVDIFFFLSGYGLVYSLRKNSLGMYYANRFFRIIPVFLIIGFLKYAAGQGGGLQAYVLATFKSVWFIYAIIVFYVVAPAIFRMISVLKDNTLKHLTVFLVMASFSLMLIAHPVFETLNGHAPRVLVSQMQMFCYLAVPRFPAFVLGMLMSSHPGLINDKRHLTSALICLAILLMLVLNAQDYFAKSLLTGEEMKYYAVLPFVFAIPAVCYWAAGIGGRLRRFPKAYSLACIIGASSLELYLWHEWVYEKAIPLMHELPSGLVLLIAIIISIFIAWLTHRLCKPLSDIHKKLFKAKA